MKILFLCHNNIFSKPRGGELSTSYIVKHLHNCGHDMHLIMEPPAVDLNYDINVQFVSRENNDAAALILAQDIKPDIILSWGSTVQTGARISILTGIPHVPFVRTWMEMTKLANFPIYLKSATTVIVNCYEGQRRLKERFGIDSDVAYVPVDDRRIVSKLGDHITFISKEKDYQFVTELATLMPDQKFLAVRTPVHLKHTPKNITYTDYIKNMAAIWAMSKIHVFPLPEGGLGTGRTPIEAQVQGIPTIVEAGCGTEEMCNNVLPKDAKISEWVSAIRYVDENLKAQSVLARKFIVENYSTRRELEKVGAIIDRIICKKKALCFIADGIGNLIQSTNALRAVKSMGYRIDLVVKPHSKSSIEMIKSMNIADKVVDYDNWDLSSPEDCKTSFAFNHAYKYLNFEHISGQDLNKNEREWHVDTVRNAGYEKHTPIACIEKSNRFFNVPTDTVVMCIDAVSKNWKFKRYNRYEKLSRSFKNVVLVGKNRELCAVPPDKFRDHCIDYVGKLNLLDTFSLISQCKIFIGHCSGLSHAAAALGTPTFIIFGPTSMTKNMPMNAYALVKERRESCQPCQYTKTFTECSDPKCLNKFKTTEVINQLRSTVKKIGLNIKNCFR